MRFFYGMVLYFTREEIKQVVRCSEIKSEGVCTAVHKYVVMFLCEVLKNSGVAKTMCGMNTQQCVKT